MTEKQDTVKLARKMSQRLIDQYNPTHWSCITIDECEDIDGSCLNCPFDIRCGFSIHQIIPEVQK